MVLPDFLRLALPVDPDDFVYATPGSISGLPDGYGWVNNAPGDPTQADADLAEADPANPHVGTYFVAQENEARHNKANRPLKALSINTDFLDGLLRRGISVPKAVAGVGTPITGTTTITIPGGEYPYLGAVTTPYDQLFKILDSDGNELFSASAGDTCVVTGTNPPHGDGTLKYGFATTPVDVAISPAIPPGTSYQLVYGVRGCLAELDRSGFAWLPIYSVPQVPGSIQRLLALLRDNLEGLDWDANWPVRLDWISNMGLNEWYRGCNYDEPIRTYPDALEDLTGLGGSFIERAWHAPSVWSQKTAATHMYFDTIDACWRAMVRDSGTSTGGSSGFVASMGYRIEDNADELRPGLFSFAAFAENKMLSTASYWGSLDTQIEWESAVDVAWSVGEMKITLSGTNYFWKITSGEKRTSLSTGIDVLEIYSASWGSGSYWRRFIIKRFSTTDPQVAYAVAVDGNDPASVAGFTGKIRWLSTVFGASAGISEFQKREETGGGDPASVLLGSFHVAAHPAWQTSTVDDGTYVDGLWAQFLAPTTGSTDYALRWGGATRLVDTNGYSAPSLTGALFGNGGLACQALACVTLHATGAATFDSSVTMNSTLGVNGNVTIDSAFAMTLRTMGSGSLINPLVFSSDAGFVTGKKLYLDTLLLNTLKPRTGSTVTVDATVTTLSIPAATTVSSLGEIDAAVIKHKLATAVVVNMSGDTDVTLNPANGVGRVTLNYTSGTTLTVKVSDAYIENPGGKFLIMIRGATFKDTDTLSVVFESPSYSFYRGDTGVVTASYVWVGMADDTAFLLAEVTPTVEGDGTVTAVVNILGYKGSVT